MDGTKLAANASRDANPVIGASALSAAK